MIDEQRVEQEAVFTWKRYGARDKILWPKLAKDQQIILIEDSRILQPHTGKIKLLERYYIATLPCIYDASFEFALAHEFGHILLEHFNLKPSPEIEAEANLFAKLTTGYTKNDFLKGYATFLSSITEPEFIKLANSFYTDEKYTKQIKELSREVVFEHILRLIGLEYLL